MIVCLVQNILGMYFKERGKALADNKLSEVPYPLSLKRYALFGQAKRPDIVHTFHLGQIAKTTLTSAR